VSGATGAAALIGIGYLLGAIPFGLLIGRWLGRIDIRQYGSHRTGTTNVLRTLGFRGAAAVFLLDLGKGAAAVLLSRWLFAGQAAISAEWVAATAGFAAIVGHNWSIFIGLSGGRGVATLSGALLALTPLAAILTAPIAAAIMWQTRYVSAGSVAGAALAPVVVLVLMLVGLDREAAHLGFAVTAGALVIGAHADNIARLRAGTERRIGERERLNA
jgi:acyl phosphate:glycerol-3-phosphate acyltransferase